MNRFERLTRGGTEARVRYLPGEIQILLPGDFVRCAVTGEIIALSQLKYWSVDLQEAYVTAEASLKRYLEIQKKS